MTPLRTLEPGLHILELSNGPTLAFKDMITGVTVKRELDEATGRIVPPGGIPLDVGCVVSNVETLYNAAFPGRPVTETFVTVNGAVKKPATFLVPVGITWREAVEPETLTVVPPYKYVDVEFKNGDQLVRAQSNCEVNNLVNKWEPPAGLLDVAGAANGTVGLTATDSGFAIVYDQRVASDPFNPSAFQVDSALRLYTNSGVSVQPAVVINQTLSGDQATPRRGSGSSLKACSNSAMVPKRGASCASARSSAGSSAWACARSPWLPAGGCSGCRAVPSIT